MIELIVNQMFSGVVRGVIYFLVACGISLLFGVVGTLNMAHFSLYMIASYMVWTFVGFLQGVPFSFLASFFLAALAMCALAWVIEFLVMRRIYSRVLTEQLIITFSLVYMLNDLTKMIWGAVPRLVTRPAILNNIVSLGGGIDFPSSGVALLSIGLAVGLIIWYMLAKTRTGRILRAAYSHKEMISCLGIPIQSIYKGMFILSVLLGCIAGASWTLVGVVELGQGNSLLIEAFCVMVIGGMGSFAGTALSSLICGLTYSFGILLLPKMATLMIFMFTGVVLSIRPWGLMGVKGRLH
jgi:branched-chain amino acid transport system permease protein